MYPVLPSSTSLKFLRLTRRDLKLEVGHLHFGRLEPMINLGFQISEVPTFISNLLEDMVNLGLLQISDAPLKDIFNVSLN